MRITLFIFVFMLAHCTCFATGGEKLKGYKLLAGVHYGYMLPEYRFVNRVVNTPIYSGEFAFIKESSGKNVWESIYNYPQQGLSFFYSTLGNDSIFGREYALTYFFRLYFNKPAKFRPFFRVGIGLSYVSRKFMLEDNFMNVAVGSKFNIHFNSKLGLSYALSKKSNLIMGLSFDHFSNANTSEPNLGLNYVTGYLAASFNLANPVEIQQKEFEKHSPSNQLAVFANIGGKHPRSLTNQYFAALSISSDFSRDIFRVLRLGIGADIFFDGSAKSLIEDDNQTFKTSNYFQTGIHITQMIVYNKWSLGIQQGIYLGLVNKIINKPIYSRGIIQYQPSKNIYVRLAMKSHIHILDYPEIGFGYVFK